MIQEGKYFNILKAIRGLQNAMNLLYLPKHSLKRGWRNSDSDGGQTKHMFLRTHYAEITVYSLQGVQRHSVPSAIHIMRTSTRGKATAWVP